MPVDFTVLDAPAQPGEKYVYALAPRLDWLRVAQVIIAVTLFVSAFIIGTVGGVILGRNGGGENDANAGAALWPFVVLAIDLALLALVMLGGRALLQRLSTRHVQLATRLRGFAEANELRYTESAPAPDYSGSLFTQAKLNKRVSMMVEQPVERGWSFGVFSWDVPGRYRPVTISAGYLTIPLDRMLPHMALSAKQGGASAGVLGLAPVDATPQSLEGDFDEWFTLYAPDGYDRDVRYIFTPDLMALLIDEVSLFDVEVIDDRMYVYSWTGFTAMGPQFFRRLFRIINVVGAKAQSQTDRYIDERVGDPAAYVVAPVGQRLGHARFSLVRVLLATVGLLGYIVGLVWLLFQLPGVATALGW